MAEPVLIIKHGAFGDIILATAAFKAIHAAHPDAHITVLTTKPFVSLLEACAWIDEVWCDERSWSPKALFALRSKLHAGKFKHVYDLQTSDRSSFYWWLMPFPKPTWSGIARFSSHRHSTPHRTRTHTLERLREQLQIAGIKTTDDAFLSDISWMQADISRFALKEPFALLVPGGSAHRPEKRWPAENYAELAKWLIEQGIQPVLIGGGAEEGVLSEIEVSVARCEVPADNLLEPGTTILNLCSQTSFFEIAELARHAELTVGNDTGPTHLAAAAGCPTIALFATRASNPDLCAPKGERVTILAATSLDNITLQMVKEALVAN